MQFEITRLLMRKKARLLLRDFKRACVLGFIWQYLKYPATDVQKQRLEGVL